MNRKVGIEKINIYGTSMFLDQKKLAVARGLDPEKVVSDFLIDTRSLNPPWEDTVTMGANAAKKVMEGIDPSEIGMLIVGTEGSVDFGKPISTNIMGALGLHHNIRNYETKHACYSGVAAMDPALSWVASGHNHGKKALVIATDFSREHLNTKEEFVMGGTAAAFIISDNPEVLEIEMDKRGNWSTDIYDTFRPTALAEVGNNEVSLYSYMDALEGSYADYCDKVGGKIDYEKDFRYNLYHTPFPGIAFQAHRTLLNRDREVRLKKKEIQADFDKRVLPGLQLSRRIGSTYGCSNFVGLSALLSTDAPIDEGDRISLFAYGSGAIGEFYSGIIQKNSRKILKSMKLHEEFDKRRECTVEEYEMIEKLRNTLIENPNFTPDFDILDGHYKKHYEGKGLLVLKDVKDYYRTYEWS
ncbi:MAG: hydroxymethylglutaryl-CoA synthase family protein [Spirochaetaceae bacterium]|nr:hydroxymethylglutaryl-CoA synthase family protein [Spirochaetaceae bacterium]